MVPLLTVSLSAKLSLSFQAIKKDQQKVFYLKVWKIDSVFFVSSLSFELSKL